MPRFLNLEIHKEEFSFSAGHFTIFSATERESLHGHNYHVSILFNVKIEHNGLSFDYQHYKRKLHKLCDQLDRRFLLPAKSPYLRLEEADGFWIGHFNEKKIPLPKEDVCILPLSNITIEELSHWFLEKLIENQAEIIEHAIAKLVVKVFNGPNQSAEAHWARNLSFD